MKTYMTSRLCTFAVLCSCACVLMANASPDRKRAPFELLVQLSGNSLEIQAVSGALFKSASYTADEAEHRCVRVTERGVFGVPSGEELNVLPSQVDPAQGFEIILDFSSGGVRAYARYGCAWRETSWFCDSDESCTASLSSTGVRIVAATLAETCHAFATDGPTSIMRCIETAACEIVESRDLPAAE